VGKHAGVGGHYGKIEPDGAAVLILIVEWKSPQVIGTRRLSFHVKNRELTTNFRRTICSSYFPTGGSMPVYDYICLDCHKPFETALTLNEHDKENPQCPHCGSKNVEQEAAAFFAVTSKKS
jgi:putative FmdB family regulatory protein